VVSVSEDVFDLLRFEVLTFFLQPVHNLLDLDGILPLVEYRRQAVDLERILSSVIDGEDVHEFAEELKVHKSAVGSLSGTEEFLHNIDKIHQHLLFFYRIIIEDHVPINYL